MNSKIKFQTIQIHNKSSRTLHPPKLKAKISVNSKTHQNTQVITHQKPHYPNTQTQLFDQFSTKTDRSVESGKKNNKNLINACHRRSKTSNIIKSFVQCNKNVVKKQQNIKIKSSGTDVMVRQQNYKEKSNDLLKRKVEIKKINIKMSKKQLPNKKKVMQKQQVKEWSSSKKKSEKQNKNIESTNIKYIDQMLNILSKINNSIINNQLQKDLNQIIKFTRQLTQFLNLHQTHNHQYKSINKCSCQQNNLLKLMCNPQNIYFNLIHKFIQSISDLSKKCLTQIQQKKQNNQKHKQEKKIILQYDQKQLKYEKKIKKLLLIIHQKQKKQEQVSRLIYYLRKSGINVQQFYNKSLLGEIKSSKQ